MKPRAQRSFEMERKELHRKLSQMGAVSPRVPAVKIRDVLVPVDFSDASVLAVRYALLFVQGFHAHITLLHVMKARPAGLSVSQWSSREKKVHEEAQQKLLKLHLAEIGKQATVTTIITSGEQVEQIVQMAQQHRMDLIIMAAGNIPAFSRKKRGNITQGVIRFAPCPVMIVRGVGENL